MRRFVLLGPLLIVSGCSGFGVFLDDTHSATNHVNRPIGNSETLLRVRGGEKSQPPALLAQAGNVWPGPVPPEPTLEELQNLPPRALPDLQGATAPTLSSVPALSVPALPNHQQPRPNYDPNVLTAPIVLPALPTARARAPVPRSGGASPQGSVVHTPSGDALSTRTDRDLNTDLRPSQSGVVIVPNGDGTSTRIGPDGSISTIPTPK